MKKEYMKPGMRIVKIKPQHIICTSGATLQMYRDSGNQIDNEADVW